MRKVFALLLLLLITAPCLRAQKKEISQARSYIKSGKDFDKAEKLMTDVLRKDSANWGNKKVLATWFVAVKKQYEQGNEKLYMKQKYDTTALFNLVKRMFEVGERLDSIDALPDKKGRTDIEYRDRHAQDLNTYRPNLFYGGTYHVAKGDFKTAFTFFQTYLDCAALPMFGKYQYEKTDTMMKDAAYWATYSGFRLRDAEKTLRFSRYARRDTSKLSFTLRYMAEAYQWQQNDRMYLVTLQKGFETFPTDVYFFPRLIDYYREHQQTEKALVTVEEALTVDPRRDIFLFAKSTLLLNLGWYDDCITVSDSLIAVNDTLPDAYYNAGTAYMNKALKLEAQRNSVQLKPQIKEMYRKALPYMERYRALAPDDHRKWGTALYRIYFNLNMGKQFDEIDKMLNKWGH